MRGSFILAISLWALGAAAEESPRREEPRAAILQALEVQATLPEQRPRLPEAESLVAESARETAAGGARRDATRTRGGAAEKSRREASERAANASERASPGASIKAARSAALGAAGVGSDAQDAAGRSRAETVRKSKEPKPDKPGNGRASEPAPFRHP